ncbi:MAG: hypothetical protein ABL914_08490 [Novosphingobium sp.]|uniref:hypothetical protein n=1 Tax=Novosphingobium sp. TaxID=1874826 RepID=UPI0032BE9779
MLPMQNLKAGAAAAMLALCAITVPAQAQVLPTRPVPLTELFSAWKAICYDNRFDTDAQIRIAKSAPFGVVEGEPDEDGTREFKGEAMLVWISGGAKNHYCAVAGNLTQAVTTADGEALLVPLIGKPSETEGERMFWELDKPDHKFTVGYGSGNTKDGIPGALIGSGVDMK